MAHIDPKSLFLQIDIYIFESNPASQVDSCIRNYYIQRIDSFLSNLLHSLGISISYEVVGAHAKVDEAEPEEEDEIRQK